MSVNPFTEKSTNDVFMSMPLDVSGLANFSRIGGDSMKTYEVLSLMIAFGMLVATIIIAAR